MAHKYKRLGCAYDPVSLFLLELFRYLEKYPDMKTFVHTVRDKEKGKHYRLYALRVVDSTGRRPVSNIPIGLVRVHLHT